MNFITKFFILFVQDDTHFNFEGQFIVKKFILKVFVGSRLSLMLSLGIMALNIVKYFSDALIFARNFQKLNLTLIF